MATRRSVEVDIFTTTHWIEGSVFPGTHGLFSYLNMPTESYIEVLDGEISPLHMISKSKEAVGNIWLVKKEIVAVLVANRAGLGTSSAVRAGYTKPFPHFIRVLVGGFDIFGMIQAGGRFDFGAVMFEGSNAFVPLFDTTLVAILFPNARAEAPALAFNRELVEALYLHSAEGD